MKKFSVFFVLMVYALQGLSWAGEGITPDSILVGQSCALSGPAADLGANMRAGLEASFAKINDAGGIKGRKVILISRDDGYEPSQAIANTRQLIEEDGVFLLIGEVGTPTSQAAVPIAEKARVPFVGPFTGAEFLRNPFKKYVINVRGSYNQEMERLVQYLVDRNGIKKVACFYQNDGYGLAGLSGLETALRKREMDIVGTGTYERNTVAVKGALLDIRKSNPEAVVMVGAYKPCAEFIRLARQVGMRDVVFANISFVGTNSLMQELGEEGDGTLVSQVVSFPFGDSPPLVPEYREALRKYRPDTPVGFVSLEGYMVGKFFAKAMAAIQGEITRENFIEAVQSTGSFDLGGVVLQFGPRDHQGMDNIFLTVIRDGQIHPMD
jgi:ABC-type branched-subunit amino acid transport system substrate-binding protein